GNRPGDNEAAQSPPGSGIFDLATGGALVHAPTEDLESAILVEEIVPGQSLLLAAHSGAAIWNHSQETPGRKFADHVDRVADLTPDRRLLLLSLDDHHMGIYDLENGRMTRSLQIPRHWR